jgi:hypothetical protein
MWDLYLDYVTYGLNSLKSRHTGFSANRLVFARELNTPLSMILENEPAPVQPDKSQHARRAFEQHKHMKAILKKVRENAEQDFLYNKRFHDRNLHGPYFKEGDYCFTFVECPAHKLSKKWQGPYKVKKVISDHVYVIELPGGEKVCNISKLKYYKKSKYSPAIIKSTDPAHDHEPTPNNNNPQRHIAVDDDLIVECIPADSAPETCTGQQNDDVPQPQPPPPDSQSHIVIDNTTTGDNSTVQQQDPVVDPVDDATESDTEDDLFVDAPEPTEEQVETAELRSRGLRLGLRPRESLKPVDRYQAGFQ